MNPLGVLCVAAVRIIFWGLQTADRLVSIIAVGSETMIRLAISLVLLISIPSLSSAQTMAQIVEGAKAEKELLAYATCQVLVDWVAGGRHP